MARELIKCEKVCRTPGVFFNIVQQPFWFNNFYTKSLQFFVLLFNRGIVSLMKFYVAILWFLNITCDKVNHGRYVCKFNRKIRNCG
jgi:hypothetical protein